MFRLALRALLGRLEQAKDFESAALRECTIETGRRAIPVAIDGEIRQLSPPLHFQCRPRALKVIVPSTF